jgi:HD-GYP domain-containing protein (c-di-GMP phosphodiesterase class II)
VASDTQPSSGPSQGNPSGQGGAHPSARFSIVEESGKPRLDFKILFPAIVLLFIAVIGVIAVKVFVDQEREREEAQWRVRMGIVADSRAAEIGRWLDRQLAELYGLAQNQSLQLYVDQIGELSADPTQADQVEGLRDYLRNLLAVTADRTGFAVKDSNTVDANETRPLVAGLMIIDAKGTVIAASADAPPFEGDVKAFVDAQPLGQRGVSDLYLNSAGNPSMIFTVPIFAVQSAGAQATQIGRIVGVKQIAEELYPLLIQPGETSQSARSVLVRLKDNKVIYLSPVADPQQPVTPLGLELGIDTADLDTAYGAQNPGGFATDKKNYRGRSVLVTARSFTLVPWSLVYTVDFDEALGAAEARFRNLTLYLLLAVALVAVIIVAVWRHGSSRRASQAAHQFQQMAQRFEDQKNLLQLVTDSQPTSIFILDKDDKYRFANKQAGKDVDIAPAEMLGKPINNVLGPALARRYVRLNHQASELNHMVSEVARTEEDGKPKVVQSEHIPLPDRSVLTVEQNITDVVMERERRMRTQRQLVKTLVDVVDKRDPFAAQHSARVAKVARAVAHEMGLTEVDVETAEIAGNLLNLGKILIPQEVLAKTGNLTEDERNMIKNSIQTSADLLQDIEFDGPVVATLRQAQANYDGTGTPAGLSGDNIVVTARVIAVANAFIGMISDRAFRAALPIDQAIENLMKGAGKTFDRRVVAALVNYLDNRDGRKEFAA